MTTTLRRPHDVAAVQSDPLGDDESPRWYIARLPDGPLVMLDDTAALIWSEALTGTEETLAERVALHLVDPDADGEMVQQAAEEIAMDVADFVAGLISQRLLERHTAYSSP